MLVNKACKFRIYPNKNKEIRIAKKGSIAVVLYSTIFLLAGMIRIQKQG
ncbi:hypothetical protein IKG_06009 [Bacillus cereus VD200]|nr:hypothetical protein IKG_06009 [Bacillus cereus VD200]